MSSMIEIFSLASLLRSVVGELIPASTSSVHKLVVAIVMAAQYSMWVVMSERFHLPLLILERSSFLSAPA